MVVRRALGLKAVSMGTWALAVRSVLGCRMVSAIGPFACGALCRHSSCHGRRDCRVRARLEMPFAEAVAWSVMRCGCGRRLLSGQVLLDPLARDTGGKQPIDTRTSSVGRSSGTPA